VGLQEIGVLEHVKYTWKRCRTLAKENPINNDAQDQSRLPSKNADSIALMCNAVKLLQAARSNVEEITEDGNIVFRG